MRGLSASVLVSVPGSCSPKQKRRALPCPKVVALALHLLVESGGAGGSGVVRGACQWRCFCSVEGVCKKTEHGLSMSASPETSSARRVLPRQCRQPP